MESWNCADFGTAAILSVYKCWYLVEGSGTRHRTVRSHYDRSYKLVTVPFLSEGERASFSYGWPYILHH
jgi:hypothetical protein